MNNLKTAQKVLSVLSIVLFAITIIAYIKVRCNDATGWGALESAGWLLISVGAISLMGGILLIKLFAYLVDFFMKKSMKALKIATILVGVVLITLMCLYGMCSDIIARLPNGSRLCVDNVSFWIFIICIAILLFIGLVSVTVLIVRKKKNIKI